MIANLSLFLPNTHESGNWDVLLLICRGTTGLVTCHTKCVKICTSIAAVTSKITLFYENKTENHTPLKHLSNNSLASGTWAVINVGIFTPNLSFFGEILKNSVNSCHFETAIVCMNGQSRQLGCQLPSVAFFLHFSSCFSSLLCSCHFGGYSELFSQLHTSNSSRILLWHEGVVSHYMPKSKSTNEFFLLFGYK